MVRALLDGSKTQTRRIFPCQSTDIIKVTQHEKSPLTWMPWFEDSQGKLQRKSWDETCRFGMIGDQLWVRETWQAVKPWDIGYVLCNPAHMDAEIHYRATADKCVPELPWRPSIFMPRFASRITLEITGVRVERLHEISENDACWEGIDTSANDCDYVKTYRQLWESINGPGSWDKNPLVWVISFQNA